MCAVRLECFERQALEPVCLLPEPRPAPRARPRAAALGESGKIKKNAKAEAGDA